MGREEGNTFLSFFRAMHVIRIALRERIMADGNQEFLPLF
jgi:hypothetical protein